ncbi:MAG: phosphotransferase [Immundisolibacterales bacterium]|nr:phosphotransferase [Immundisolibacterales bacterium]
MARDEQIRPLHRLATAAPERHDLPPGAEAHLVSVSENAIYRVDSPDGDGKWALRVHREGYRRRNGIASWLAWLAALREDGAVVTPRIEALFASTVEVLCRRLEDFGKSAERFNLIHGDTRLANLLIDGPITRVIDFDDCGFGWLMYDCATTVSFFEHKPEVPELIAAWLRGYRKVVDLPRADAEEIPTFVMLRRLLLVAWIGSHAETEFARSLGVGYTEGSVPLCEDYLARFGQTAKPASGQPDRLERLDAAKAPHWLHHSGARRRSAPDVRAREGRAGGSPAPRLARPRRFSRTRGGADPVRGRCPAPGGR